MIKAIQEVFLERERGSTDFERKCEEFSFSNTLPHVKPIDLLPPLYLLRKVRRQQEREREFER